MFTKIRERQLAFFTLDFRPSRDMEQLRICIYFDSSQWNSSFSLIFSLYIYVGVCLYQVYIYHEQIVSCERNVAQV